MPNYTCENCGKNFSQKGHYDNHIQRKTPCKKIDNNIINKKIKELSDEGKIEVKDKELQNKLITDLEIKNEEGLKYLESIKNNSIDLILTDPPYITSSDSGMDKLNKQIKENKEKGIKFVKTEDDWNKWKESNKNKLKELRESDKKEDINLEEFIESKKEKFLIYGSIYGKKYSIQTNYGEWDENFTMETLELFIKEYYDKLRKGGTVIIFFDLWKITPLKELLEKYKFKQIRFIEWIKTNPQPLNSSTNYLTNCREIALLAVKGGKPTFNSKYDKAIYEFPLQGGKNRFHPTQKSLLLFEELIKKHSNEGDMVMDTFLGSGTTAIACKNMNRKFKGCEVSKEFYDKMMKIIK